MRTPQLHFTYSFRILYAGFLFHSLFCSIHQAGKPRIQFRCVFVEFCSSNYLVSVWCHLGQFTPRFFALVHAIAHVIFHCSRLKAGISKIKSVRAPKLFLGNILHARPACKVKLTTKLCFKEDSKVLLGNNQIGKGIICTMFQLVNLTSSYQGVQSFFW